MKSIEKIPTGEQHLIVWFCSQNHSKVEKRICKKVVIFKNPKKPRFILILNQNQNFLLFSDLAFSGFQYSNPKKWKTSRNKKRQSQQE
jgi:hypothetical protein